MKSFDSYIKELVQNDPKRKSEMEFSSWLLELGLNVARMREGEGWSQADFAKRLDIPQSSVARIESGQNMRCSTLWKISEVLDVELKIFDTSSAIESEKFKTFCNTSMYSEITLDKKTLEYTTEASASNTFFNFNANGKPAYAK